MDKSNTAPRLISDRRLSKLLLRSRPKLKQYSNRPTNRSYCMKVDIRSFYASIQPECIAREAKKQLRRIRKFFKYELGIELNKQTT